MSAALVFAEKHNMTPQFIINAEDYWGDVYENWTGTGLLGNLIVDQADVGFGKL